MYLIDISDRSEFEGKLQDSLVKQIKTTNFDVQTKLLICTVSNLFDGFNGHMEKVTFKILTYQPLLLIFQDLFENHNHAEIVTEMMNLNLQDKKNKEIVQLVTTKEGVEIDEEVEFKVFSLAKKLKNTGITKPTPLLTSEISSQPRNSFAPAPTVNINFHFNNHHDVNFTIGVNTSLSVDELIDQVFAKRQVKNGVIAGGLSLLIF